MALQKSLKTCFLKTLLGWVLIPCRIFFSALYDLLFLKKLLLLLKNVGYPELLGVGV